MLHALNHYTFFSINILYQLSFVSVVYLAWLQFNRKVAYKIIFRSVSPEAEFNFCLVTFSDGISHWCETKICSWNILSWNFFSGNFLSRKLFLRKLFSQNRICIIWHWLKGLRCKGLNIASLGITGNQLRAPFQPFNTIESSVLVREVSEAILNTIVLW